MKRRRNAPRLVTTAICTVAAMFASQSPVSGKARPSGTTFNRDVAPIVFSRCGGCHRPGESGPFDLLSYADVSKRAKQIVKVTQKRIMPPWMPDAGYGEFAEERRLTADELETIQDWVKQGAREGNPADLPPAPNFTKGWQLGEPDLVLTMPAAFNLKADGKDVYRNFVIPIPLKDAQFVRAYEFRPNSRVVHHAFMFIDGTPTSRILDEKDPEPGFEGMRSLPETAQFPEGHVLGWQPGRLPRQVPEGMSWKLEPGADLLVQVHLQPSGKPEPIQCSVGLYFTDDAPRRRSFMLDLNSWEIDIPAGEKNYVREESYTLPVDVEVLGVMPHAHYLGKTLTGYAILPDGTKQGLLRIANWNFNWQGDYRYKEPVFLPKGTVLHKHFTFDNSEGNPHNPSHPPKAVTYGALTTDEMGELWFQVVPKSNADYQTLTADKQAHWFEKRFRADLKLIETHPNDATALLRLGKAFLIRGIKSLAEKESSLRDAERLLRAAAESDPENDESHYYLAVVYKELRREPEFLREVQAAISLNPKNYKALNLFGSFWMETGRLRDAEAAFVRALAINPKDRVVMENLAKVRAAMRDSGQQP